jgi:hypothetical protein
MWYNQSKEKTNMDKNNVNEMRDKNYLESCSHDDMELRELIYEYEHNFFEDMMFDMHSPLLSAFLSGMEDKEDDFDYGEFIFDLDSYGIRCFVKTIEGSRGLYDINEKAIYISPENKDNKRVILHEMIHAYEESIRCRKKMPYLFDILFINLYNNLKKKVDNLDDLILEHGNFESAYDVDVEQEGGSHGILFYLKSLDLDLRLGYKLGTVCGYGRDEYE